MKDQGYNQKTWEHISRVIEKYGFFLIGFVELGKDPEFVFFKQWIDEGRHANMKFLEKYQEIRESPGQIDSFLKYAIVIGLHYGFRENIPRDNGTARIAQYARYQDYHKIFWRQGPELLNEIHELLGVPLASGRVFCDSAPLLERSLAVRAGDVLRGKNTCIISRKKGSMFFLGELFTSAILPPYDGFNEEPEKAIGKKDCGRCRRCQVHCPTGALDEDYRLDARKCIAFWTIENRGLIPEQYWEVVSRYIFGCDICQLVCPFNRVMKEKGQVDKNAYSPLIPRSYPDDPLKLVLMSQEQYEEWFGGTPLTRAKKEGLIRNALICLYVTQPSNFFMVAAKLRKDPSLHPVIEGTIKQGMTLSGCENSNQ